MGAALSRYGSGHQIMELNDIRERFVTEVRSLAEGFAGKKKTVAEYSRCLYEFIVQSRDAGKTCGTGAFI